MDIFPLNYLVDRVKATFTKAEYEAFEKLIERGTRNMARLAKQNGIEHSNEFCLNVGMFGSANTTALELERTLYIPVDLFRRSRLVDSYADKVKSALQDQEDDTAAKHRQALRDARTLFMRTLANKFGDYPIAYPVLPTSVTHIDPNKPRGPKSHNAMDYLKAHKKKVIMNVFIGPLLGIRNEAFLCGDKMMREYMHIPSVISEGLISADLSEVALYWDNAQQIVLRLAAKKVGDVYRVVDANAMERLVGELRKIDPDIGFARGALSRSKLGMDTETGRAPLPEASL